MVYWRYFRERGTQSRRNSCVARSRFFFFKQKTAYEIGHVTGVQTCALPISEVCGTASAKRAFWDSPSAQRKAVEAIGCVLESAGAKPSDIDAVFPSVSGTIQGDEFERERSEERRVGKEGSGRSGQQERIEKE